MFCGRISGIGNFSTYYKWSYCVFCINDDLVGITPNSQNMLPSIQHVLPIQKKVSKDNLELQ